MKRIEVYENRFSCVIGGHDVPLKNLTGLYRFVNNVMEVEQKTIFGRRWISEYNIIFRVIEEFDCNSTHRGV